MKKSIKLNVEKIRGFNVWVFIWESLDLFYSITGLRLQKPIEYFYPNFGPWLFSKIMGKEGTKIDD